jgi:RNA polymerase sigma-70 factor (ECF subfamily)
VTRGEVLIKLRERMIAFAASRISRDVAEDLAQEVLVVLEEKYPEVERTEDLLPLSLQILRFKLTAAWRKVSRRGENRAVAVEDIQIADPRENPETAAGRAEMFGKLRAALKRMEPRCRQLLAEAEGELFLIRRSWARSIHGLYPGLQARLCLMGGRWRRVGDEPDLKASGVAAFRRAGVGAVQAA